MAENKVDIKEEEDYEVSSKPLKEKPDCTWETTLDMVTWNTYGSTPADIRHTIVPIVKRLLPSDTITFLQEVYKTNVTKKWKYTNVVLSANDTKREAGVSTPRSEKVKISDNTDDILTEKSLSVFEEEFISRMCGRIVTIMHKFGSSEYANKVVMISYHAPYIGLTDEDKKSKIVEFFGNMCILADDMKKTVIIGGDFNLSVSDWRDDVQKKYPERVSVATYVASPRRWTSCIDTFAIVQPIEGGTQCSFINTTAIYPFPTVGNFGGSENKLVDYPNAKHPWFKFIHYSDGDKEQVEKLIENWSKEAEKKAQRVKRDNLTSVTPCSVNMRDYTPIYSHTFYEETPNPQTGLFDRYRFYTMIPNTSKCSCSEFDLHYSDNADEETYSDEYQYIGSMPDYDRGIMCYSYIIIRTPQGPCSEKCAQYSSYSEEDKPNVKESKAQESPKQQSIPPPAPFWARSPLHRVIDHDPVLTTIKFTLNLKSPSDVDNESSTSPVIRRSVRKHN